MSTPAASLPLPPAGSMVKPLTHWQDRLAHTLLVLCCALLALFLLGPLFMILVKNGDTFAFFFHLLGAHFSDP